MVFLRALGCDALVVWECQIQNTSELEAGLVAFLGPARQTLALPVEAAAAD